MAANANHLNDRRPQFTDPNENPVTATDATMRLMASGHGSSPNRRSTLRRRCSTLHRKKATRERYRRQVEPPFRYVLAGTRDVTDIDRVQARDNSGESLFALSLPIGRTKTVAIHEFLDQLRVDDEVTMVRMETQGPALLTGFRGPCAV